nr:hypothetical protein [Tanacetum cinerariifolium]
MRRVGKGFSGDETPLFKGMLVIGENVEEGIAAEQVQDDAAVAAAQEGVTATIGEDVQEQSIPSPTPPPHPPQDLPSTSSVQPTPPPSPQPQPQVVDFPFGLLQTALDTCAALTSRIEQLEFAKMSQALEISKLKKRVKRLEKSNKVKVFKLRRLKKVRTSQRIDTSDDTIMEDVSNQGRMIDELDRDEGVALTVEKEEERKTKEAKNSDGDDQVKGRQAEIYQIDIDHPSKVLSMQEDEPAKVEEVVEVVTTAKLITEVVVAASKSVSAASITIPAAEPQVPAATPTAVPVKVAAASTRRRKRVVIRDPEEESTAKTPAETKSKDKGKGIMVEEPKPMKKKEHVEIDEEYAKKLHKEVNQDIDWDVAINHVKQKAKEDPYVQRYQVMKKRPQTEAQARRNMIMYLKNVVGFRLDYFKGMKVLVVDYSIIFLNNKPHYKIVKADGTHQLYISFLTLLKNFDRDDLESLWSIMIKLKSGRIRGRSMVKEGLRAGRYEKPSTKLTFYKAFFLSQWKFLIHTILQSISAKRTSWNEFSLAMASIVICLSIGGKFNLSKYIFESLVRNVDNSSKFYMYPRRVGKGFSGVETPLFEGMLVVGENVEEGIAAEQVQDDADVAAAQEGVTAAIEEDVQEQSIPSPTPPPQLPQDLPSISSVIEQLESAKMCQALEISKLKKRVKRLEKDDTIMEDVSNQRRMIDELDRDEGFALTAKKEEAKKTKEAKNSAGNDQVKGRQAEINQIDMDHPLKVLSMQEDESDEVEEVVEVVTTAKLITEVVAAASKSVSASSTTIPAAEQQVLVATPTAVLVRVAVASTRRRKKVVIRDPEEESTVKILAETKSKDKGKGIMVKEPKPMKKKQQVEMEEEYTKKLHEELNQDIISDVAIDHVKQKAKEDPYVQRYQVMKKRPQIEAQARRNMIMYLKNVAGFRLDYFKGMSYDVIRPIFEAKFNTNIEFLLKSKEQIEEEERRAIESINETPAQKVAKGGSWMKRLQSSTSIWRLCLIKTMMYLQRLLRLLERTVYGQARVKSWKLLESCGVHIVTLSTTQLILLVERKYPLSRYTLDQMLNAVKLRVEEQSEMSLELLRFIRQQSMVEHILHQAKEQEWNQAS